MSVNELIKCDFCQNKDICKFYSTVVKISYELSEKNIQVDDDDFTVPIPDCISIATRIICEHYRPVISCSPYINKNMT